MMALENDWNYLVFIWIVQVDVDAKSEHLLSTRAVEESRLEVVGSTITRASAKVGMIATNLQPILLMYDRV